MFETPYRALEKSGLPRDPTQVIGRAFLFGDNEHFIGGTIRSIGYGPEEGIVLYVTPPRFRGGDIKRLAQRNGEWVAVCEDGTEKEGDLLLL